MLHATARFQTHLYSKESALTEPITPGHARRFKWLFSWCHSHG